MESSLKMINLLCLLFTLARCSRALEYMSSSNTLVRVTSFEDETVMEEEEVSLCYEFTWLGPATDETVDTTSPCIDNVDDEGRPCFEPLVWTIGPDRVNGPNVTQIEEACGGGDVQGGVVGCTPTCINNDNNVCVKMTYYLRDDDRTPTYSASFCGLGVLANDDGQPITSGCHVQEDAGNGLQLEACFCDTDRCNA